MAGETAIAVGADGECTTGAVAVKAERINIMKLVAACTGKCVSPRVQRGQVDDQLGGGRIEPAALRGQDHRGSSGVNRRRAISGIRFCGIGNSFIGPAEAGGRAVVVAAIFPAGSQQNCGDEQ